MKYAIYQVPVFNQYGGDIQYGRQFRSGCLLINFQPIPRSINIPSECFLESSILDDGDFRVQLFPVTNALPFC
jgi:hypothetical protein